MNEIWKDVLNWEEYYEVSDLGRIKSKPRKYWKPDPKMPKGGCWQFRKSRLLKTPPNSERYPHTRLSKDGKCYSVKVHRLVWEAFHGTIPEGYHIDHMDGSRDNNRLDNLQCVSPQEHRVETLEREFGCDMMPMYKDFGRGMGIRLSKAYREGYAQAQSDMFEKQVGYPDIEEEK